MQTSILSGIEKGNRGYSILVASAGYSVHAKLVIFDKK